MSSTAFLNLLEASSPSTIVAFYIKINGSLVSVCSVSCSLQAGDVGTSFGIPTLISGGRFGVEYPSSLRTFYGFI
jgi:hypothetical protein